MSYTLHELVEAARRQREDTEKRIAEWLRTQVDSQLTVVGAAMLIENGDYRKG